MYNKCCVVGCDSRRKNFNLFRMPKTEIGLQKWLQCLNCERLRSLSRGDLLKEFVCQKHFEKRFFKSTQTRPRLCVGAYPTLFTASEIQSGVPQAAHAAETSHPTDTVNIEHCYSKKRPHEDHTYFKTELSRKKPRTQTALSSIVSDQPSTSGISCGEKECIMKPTTSGAVPSTPKLVARKRRVISKRMALSPQCTKLYKEYVKSRKQLQFNQKVRRALKFSKERSFEKLTEKMNPLAKKVLWMQIKHCTKKSKGRRFSQEEKLISLSIMKQSPKCYKFLQKIFILPSKQTLNKMIMELNIEPGINTQVLQAVKEEVDTWAENKKYCSIMFDEVSLEAALNYDSNRDYINGLVELQEKTSDFADHALVFMLRGAIHKWQQPLAYYFCKGATSAIQLKNIIKDVVTAVGNTGLLPIALISDQGTAFQSALKSLQEDTRREQIRTGNIIDDVIDLGGHTLSVIHDPPHLIKGLRNNFLTKNIKFENKISKWNDIVEVYKTDCNHAQMRLLYKLNDEHVIPDKIRKMKVKNCTRVFSKTVAATLSYTAQFSQYADGKPVSQTLKNTAEIVSFFDDLFDSVNGASLMNKKNKGKPLRQAVTGSSPHHTFWSDAIKKLGDIKYVDPITNKETSVPSLKNWITTLKSYQRLWRFFQSKNIKIMRPRYYNSDPIENFFGQVRAYNFRNNDPNCHTFKNTFKSLLITRFIKFHSETYNCEEDSAEQLVKLKALFEGNKNDVTVAELNSAESTSYRNVHVENIPTTAIQERLSVHSRAYTTGWVIRKFLNIINCQHCTANLTSSNRNIEYNSVNNWITFKEFKSLKERKLTYPSEAAVRSFGEITKEAIKYLENQPQQRGIINKIKSILKFKYLFGFLDCNEHRDSVCEYFLHFTLRLTVFNWCNVINKILKGTDVSRLENKILPPMQMKAFNMYKRKLRNKKHK